MATRAGADNKAFEDYVDVADATRRQPNDDIHEDTLCRDIELQACPTILKQKSSLKDDQSSAECMAWISRCKSCSSGFCTRHGKEIRVAVIVLLLALFHAYFIAAVVNSFEKAKALVILTTLAWLLVLYYKVITVYCFPYLHKNCYLPFKKMIFQIWGHTWLRGAVYCCLAAAVIVLVLGITAPNWEQLTPFCAIFVFLLFLFFFSNNQSKIRWRPVLWGYAFQFLLGLTVMKWQPGVDAFQWLASELITFLDYTVNGTSFVYGFLAVPPPICGLSPVFLFSVLQTIIYFGSCVAVLYHYGIMQFVLMKFAWLMQVTLTTTAAESLNAIASVFLGMTEAPILVRPYLAKLTKAEVFAVLCGGFSTAAGSLFAAYVSFGACPAYVLSAGIMNAPAALASAKLFYPETEESKTKFVEDLRLPKGQYKNILEAISNGATTVITIVFQIGANLIAFIALLAFVDAAFAWLGEMVGIEGFSFEKLLGYMFFPVAFLMGVSLNPDMQKRIEETMLVAELLGTKIVLNEFIAYQKMSTLVLQKRLSARAQMMSSYALASFGNISSIGIQMGSLGGLCPEQKSVLAEVAVRALLASICATFITTCWAGILMTSPEACQPSISASHCFDLQLAIQRQNYTNSTI